MDIESIKTILEDPNFQTNPSVRGSPYVRPFFFEVLDLVAPVPAAPRARVTRLPMTSSDSGKSAGADMQMG